MGPVTQKAPPTMSEDSIERGFRLNSRQRPSLPRSRPRSTIGPEGLNFRVRDGNGCDPLGKITEKPDNSRQRTNVLGRAQDWQSLTIQY